MSAWLTDLVASARASHAPVWLGLQCTAMLGARAWFRHRTNAPELHGLRAPLVAGYMGAAVGARAFAALVDLPSVLRSGRGLHTLVLSGQMAYGALFGLVLVYAVAARRRGFRILESLDLLAPTIGVLIGFARLGCFFGGCDFGRPTSVAWAVRYPHGSPAFHQHVVQGLLTASDRTSLAVHPTQLYEAGLGVLVALAALLPGRRADAGLPFARAVATYALGRFMIELLRGDLGRGALWGASTSQWLSVVVLTAGGVWLARRRETPGARVVPAPRLMPAGHSAST